MSQPVNGIHYLKMKGTSASGAKNQLLIINSFLIVQLSSQTNHDIGITGGMSLRRGPWGKVPRENTQLL